MSKRQFLCLMGVWVMLFLFLGVPSSWHKVIGVISGLIILITAYTLPSAQIGSGESKETFTENKQM